jgi:hypothetical protein
MEVSGEMKSKWISLDISPLFFYIVSKLVQAPVITYDKTEDDVLLPKPFLDLGFNGVVRWKSVALEMFLNLPNT